jgi:hypothetical protein
MKKPNFFIAGAPKSGTTALSEYLREHPNIFITTPKEPNFFADDMPKRYMVNTLDNYLALYNKCNSNHYAAGEASVFYLYSSCALKNINHFNNKAKIIVMLRNPVDLVHSLHSQYIFNFTENEKDFEKAWYLQESRKTGINLPQNCRVAKILQYKPIGMIGSQVEKLYNIFPEKQVMLILFDDFVLSNKQVYEEVLKFLQVPTDGRLSFPLINESKKPLFNNVGRLIHDPPNFVRKAAHIIFKASGVDAGEFIARFISSLNSRKEKRKGISPDFRKKLIMEFSCEINKLSKILNRDLSHWMH